MLGEAENSRMEIFEHQGLKLLMIPRTAEYAIRAVVYLANPQGQAFPSRDIAAATGVPHGYMSKVLHSLAKVGFVSSQRGIGGGYMLTANPARLTLLDILIAIDPSFDRMRRTLTDTQADSGEQPLSMRVRLGHAMGQVIEVLGTTTIAKVVDEMGPQHEIDSAYDAQSDGEGAD